MEDQKDQGELNERNNGRIKRKDGTMDQRIMDQENERKNGGSKGMKG